MRVLAKAGEREVAVKFLGTVLTTPISLRSDVGPEVCHLWSGMVFEKSL